MRVHIESYGCTLNHGEARLMGEMLQENGHVLVSDTDSADAHLLVTCTVIESTERRMIERMKALSGTGKKLIVAGCMASAQRDTITNVAPKAILLPPREMSKVFSILGKGEAAQPSQTPAVNLLSESIDAIVPISQGCLGRCTYCITKLARGALRSYDPESILSQVRKHLTTGFKEIRLTAQDTTAYGQDIDTNLAGLLKSIAFLPGDFKIRVGMANPATCLLIIDDLIEAYSSKKVYKFLHLPVQSGDDDILEAMGRDYKTKDFKSIVQKFRQAYPDLTLSTDIIVGFPGETEDQFSASMQLIEKIKPDIVNVTRFSPRPGTQAYSMSDQIVGWKVKERSRALTKLRFILSRDLNSSYEGKILEVMTTEKGKDRTTRARAFNYKQVILKGDWSLGQSTNAKIIEGREVDLIAEAMEWSKAGC